MSDKESCPKCGERGRYAAFGMFWGFKCDRCGHRANNYDYLRKRKRRKVRRKI
jgi:tRNA(Ile2) C34 agmatinyltransferase TiaS